MPAKSWRASFASARADSRSWRSCSPMRHLWHHGPRAKLWGDVRLGLSTARRIPPKPVDPGRGTRGKDGFPVYLQQSRIPRRQTMDSPGASPNRNKSRIDKLAVSSTRLLSTDSDQPTQGRLGHTSEPLEPPIFPETRWLHSPELEPSTGTIPSCRSEHRNPASLTFKAGGNWYCGAKIPEHRAIGTRGGGAGGLSRTAQEVPASERVTRAVGPVPGAALPLAVPLWGLGRACRGDRRRRGLETARRGRPHRGETSEGGSRRRATDTRRAADKAVARQSPGRQRTGGAAATTHCRTRGAGPPSGRRRSKARTRGRHYCERIKQRSLPANNARTSTDKPRTPV